MHQSQLNPLILNTHNSYRSKTQENKLIQDHRCKRDKSEEIRKEDLPLKGEAGMLKIGRKKGRSKKRSHMHNKKQRMGSSSLSFQRPLFFIFLFLGYSTSFYMNEKKWNF